jgi:broad specificity phosphatase PhoE
MRIYFVRHGESYANISGEMSARGLKHPLTALGRQQAHALAERLRFCSISRIYSSPILRAIETTVLIANDLGIDYEVNDALREYDIGILEGQKGPETWRRWQELFDAWTRDRNYSMSLEGGETFDAIRQRFVPFVNTLVSEYAETTTGLLCVAHGGLYWMMLPEVLSNVGTDDIHRCGGFRNTTTVVAEYQSGQLVCVEWDGIPYAHDLS